jgi:nuclease-like protein
MARRLRRLGRDWTVFHDLAIPNSRGNADHLVTGQPGVFLIDSNYYRSRLTLTPEGTFVVRLPPTGQRPRHRPLGSLTALV